MSRRVPFEVTVEAHDVPPRWHVAGRSMRVWARDATSARAVASREAHRRAGVPPLRSLLRVTYPRTSARAIRTDRLGRVLE